MAGASKSITINVDDKQVQQALKNAADKVGNLKPALSAIGESLLLSIDQRFIEQKDPNNRAWKRLSDATKSLRRPGKSILQTDGHLRGSMVYRSNKSELEVGTNKVYAAMHQFGGVTSDRAMIANKDIPARPFLGLSKNDRDEILEIMADYIQNSLPF